MRKEERRERRERREKETFNGEVSDTPASSGQQMGRCQPDLQTLQDNIETAILGNGFPVLLCKEVKKEVKRSERRKKKKR